MSKINFSTVSRWLTIEHLVHGVMIVFALASVGNLVEFMSHGHNLVTAWGVGLALGGGLVAVSIMFTKVDIHDRGTFWPMLAAMLAMGVLSGWMQTIAYSATGTLWIAALQGFGFPLVGECLLAYASAMFTHSERKRRQAQADDAIEQRIADAIDEAMQSIDVSGARKHVEKAADRIVKSKMDALLAKRIGTIPPAEPAASQDIADNHKPSVSELNEARQRLAHERQRAITELIGGYGPLSTTELVTKLAEDRNIQASERTVRADCSQLEATGQLVKDGRRWAQPMAIASLLPAQPVATVNGKGAH